MAITLDATVGGAASNSYLTLARCNTLMEQLPHANAWILDAGINKAQLLLHATRLIDRSIEFFGDRTADTQALEWPRKNVKHHRTNNALSDATIPEFIEWATAEWAFELHVDSETSAPIAPGLKSLRTPSYSAEFDSSRKLSIPTVVAELLLDYGTRAARGGVRLIRT